MASPSGGVGPSYTPETSRAGAKGGLGAGSAMCGTGARGQEQRKGDGSGRAR